MRTRFAPAPTGYLHIGHVVNAIFVWGIARVRGGNLEAYAHQDVPFERLVEVLNPVRSLSRHPLFQVMLAFQNTAPVGLQLDGVAGRFEPVATATSKFDLALSLGEAFAADLSRRCSRVPAMQRTDATHGRDHG